jgi:signal transduction histidine kinase
LSYLVRMGDADFFSSAEVADALTRAGVCVVRVLDGVLVEETQGTHAVLGLTTVGVSASELLRRCHVDDLAQVLSGEDFQCRWWTGIEWVWLHGTLSGTRGARTIVLRRSAEARLHQLRAEALAEMTDGVIDTDRHGSVTWSVKRGADPRVMLRVLEHEERGVRLFEADGKLWEVQAVRHEAGVLYVLWDTHEGLESARRDVRWRRLMDGLSDGYVLEDASGNIVECNTAAASLLGRSVEAVLLDGSSMLPDDGVSDGAGGRVLSVRRQPCVLQDGRSGMIALIRDVTEETRLRDALGAVVATLANVREEERSALATLLHDDPIQRLAGVRWRVMAVDDEAAEELERCYESLRDVVTTLRSQAFFKQGLRAALEELAGLDPRVFVLVEDVSAVSARTAALVLRNAREAVRNAVAHSRAEAIKLEVATKGSQVVCVVSDDGGGVSADELLSKSLSGHVGVVTMRETVLGARGWFEISSGADGRGTRVAFGLPVLTEQR